MRTKIDNSKMAEYPVDIGLRAWTNGIDTVAAYSAEDAISVVCELSGNKKESMEDDEKDYSILGMSDIKTVFDEGSGEKITKTVKEWVDFDGRGLLWSTEY